ncbi:MAG: hypothetical protein HZB98_14230 [Bacteroidia bacterium]|nr:hypothetical protein [Bacteroidia bacterium]
MNRFFHMVWLFAGFLITNSQKAVAESRCDTLPENQPLYNGRVWYNLYSGVEENQFLFSEEFLPGTVTMRGRTYSNIQLRYDIYKDEILIPYRPVGILQLNKEMVDSFSINFPDREYRFVRLADSSEVEMNGYFNEVYSGKTALIARYQKKIEKLADGGRYDKFYQVNKSYISIDGKFRPIAGKKDLYRIFSNDKKPIRNYIKKNNIQIIRDDAESYVPVLKFIDTLQNQ